MMILGILAPDSFIPNPVHAVTKEGDDNMGVALSLCSYSIYLGP